jgi:Cu/Ag efflux protein CusF
MPPQDARKHGTRRCSQRSSGSIFERGQTMLRTHRQIVAAVLLAAGIAGVGVMAGPPLSAADDQEKKAREELQAAETQLRAAEAQVKLARAKYEQAMNAAKNAQFAQKEAPLRQQLQSVEWTVEQIRAERTGEFTLRLNHSKQLFLTDLPVARIAAVSIDNVPGKVADLKIGMRIEIRLAADDLVVTKIDAFAPEPKPYLIKEVDVAKKTISVTRAGKEFVTSLSVGDAEILLEGDDDGGLKDLKPGMQVSLSFVATGGQLSLRKIHARK